VGAAIPAETCFAISALAAGVAARSCGDGAEHADRNASTAVSFRTAFMGNFLLGY
jgi:hypothetical protein